MILLWDLGGAYKPFEFQLLSQYEINTFVT